MNKSTAPGKKPYLSKHDMGPDMAAEMFQGKQRIGSGNRRSKIVFSFAARLISQADACPRPHARAVNIAAEA